MGNTFQPRLKLMDATMIVAGSMIGSGIFIVSSDITRQIGSPGWLMMVWALTGFMTLVAALSYGELSAMYPKAGGQYVYLKEAYNPLTGFLYGWSFFSVIQTGTIAAVGVAFAKFTAYFIPAVSEDNILFKFQYGVDECNAAKYFTISAAQVVSIGLIIFLTYINTKGIKSGKIIQNLFTGTKLIALFAIIIFGFILFKWDVWSANWSNGWESAKYIAKDACNKDLGYNIIPITGAAFLGGIAAAMVGSIFSSDAWNNITFIAGEVKNPQRNIGLSLFLGTLIVTVIYLAINMVYLAQLPMDSIATAEKDRVALSAANEIFGSNGVYIIAALIMVSTFGCNNGLILAGARVYYTMAKDGLFFKKTARLNKNDVPEFGLWIQCAMAALLCLSGKYGDLLDMISFVAVLFYVLTILGIYILRKKQPQLPRPYKAFGYPLLPAIYILMGLAFCTLLILYKQQYTWPGLVIVLIGIPLYYLAVGRKK